MDAASEAAAGIAFGRFLLLPHRRELLADGRPVKLGRRAFDVLMVLIEARGAVVSKDALMARAWPDRIVEENNPLRAAVNLDLLELGAIEGPQKAFIGSLSVPPHYKCNFCAILGNTTLSWV